MNAGTAPDYMSFLPITDATASYNRVVCALQPNPETRPFTCCLLGECRTFATLPGAYTDARVNTLKFGSSSSYVTLSTMSYDIVPCPAAC
jgi:hypothetical protein